MDRPDNSEAVMKYAGRYTGGKALVILGGYSGAGWKKVRDEIKPDVLLGANGVNGKVKDLDFWMCMENMTRASSLAETGDARSIELMKMFHRKGGKTNFLSYLSWNLVKDTSDCICARRWGDAEILTRLPDNFSLRDYGQGFMSGWLLKRRQAGAAVHVGTVGTHLLHLAGILGCAEVHTIGYDLIFRDGYKNHHWYHHPTYQVDRFRTPDMFIEHKGARTQWVWLETAQFLKEIEPLFERDSILWVDHSNGLLSIEGLKCAKKNHDSMEDWRHGEDNAAMGENVTEN
jgi:hypothetical protein